MAETARALFHVAPMRSELREVPLAAPGPGEALVRTEFSAISRGTERLVARGAVPAEEHGRMRCPMQEGDFPFPVKYGYAAVGIVEDGPADLLGRRVFALHPHQNRFVAPLERLHRVPDAVPAMRATLAANLETALNAVWDSGVSVADRVVVVGGGLVGLLVAALCAGMPGTRVTVVDVDPSRAAAAADFGASFAPPEAAPTGADVVFHTSATAAGLATAIAAAGPEAEVVELSWYGAGEIAVALGGAFHAGRIGLVSSQVGRVSPGHAARGWTFASRLAAALDLAADPRLDRLIGEIVPFADLPAAMPRLLAAGAPGIVTLVRYEE
ncbi:dehydrogenase [Pinisolibacter sp.]|uniref:dehydrogenase n=1 Tax=Pinisolibacter sp. TaxID=2172024 RepID=UPI002FDE4874